MQKPQVQTTLVNVVCRTCNLVPILHPSQCPQAQECFATGPQAERRGAAAAVKRARGQGVRKVIQYEESDE